VDTAYNIYLALYQGLSDSKNPDADAYRQFTPGFFDLVVVDECHRGSAREDSKWREILDYFSAATHLGMTATPKETATISSSEYFGDPLYTYSLKQGIDDGFLAPYKVVKLTLDIDAEGWRPPKGFLDKSGQPVEDRIYNRSDFDKTIVVEERRRLVARKITEFLKGHDRFAKTIVFCVDIEHAEAMRSELAKANPDLVAANPKYVMQITGDNPVGKAHLDAFINPSERYPVIATTSKLMTTGVDAQTCQLIVLDANIGSPSEFKQIIGRGTRINEDFGKHYFTIMDFRNVTALFADPGFDGDPVRVKVATGDDDLSTVENEPDATTVIDELSGSPVDFVDPAAPAVKKSSSTASRSPSSKSASNTSATTARSLPSHSATTPEKTSAAPTPRSTISSPPGATPSASAPCSTNLNPKASSSPPCKTRSAMPSIPSTSSATSLTTAPHSPAANAPNR
jgi:type I restriction enzyme R subunit